MLNWYAITSTAYYAAEPDSLSDENLYFLTDTHELYRGQTPFTDAVILYSGERTSTPARNKIYVNSSTLQGDVYTGSEWVTVIKPVVGTVTPDGTDPVNSAAVIAYVTQAIADVTGGDSIVKNISYNDGTLTLTVTKGDDSSEQIVLEGIGTQLHYDAATGALEIRDVTGAPLGSAINLDLERFVSAAAYDETNQQIILAFNDITSIDTGASYTYPDTMPGVPTDGMACRAGGTWYWYNESAWEEVDSDKLPLTINVGDLVDTYTAQSTASIQLTVSNNQFTANAIASSTAGNQLTIDEYGLYVAATDLSNYQTLVASASTTMIPMLNAQGQIINGTMTPGGATIAGSPNATTLATELAVNTLVQSTKTTIDASLAQKMNLVTGATNGHVATLNATGQAQDSGKAIGGATLAGSPNENTLATEAAVSAAIAPVQTAVTTLNADSDTPGSVDYKIAQATTNMLESTDIVTELSSSVTDQQVPSAKVVYDQLTWKTSL